MRFIFVSNDKSPLHDGQHTHLPRDKLAQLRARGIDIQTQATTEAADGLLYKLIVGGGTSPCKFQQYLKPEELQAYGCEGTNDDASFLRSSVLGLVTQDMHLASLVGRAFQVPDKLLVIFIPPRTNIFLSQKDLGVDIESKNNVLYVPYTVANLRAFDARVRGDFKPFLAQQHESRKPVDLTSVEAPPSVGMVSKPLFVDADTDFALAPLLDMDRTLSRATMQAYRPHAYQFKAKSSDDMDWRSKRTNINEKENEPPARALNWRWR